MKFSTLAIAFLSISLVSACTNDGQEMESTDVDARVSTNESVKLPVAIYKKDNYYAGEDVSFIRTIEEVEVSDFDESTAIDFTDRYDSQIKNLDLDLINDYKRVLISMSHATEGETTKKPLEAFILDETSEILLNNEPVLDDEVVHQVKLSTLDYRMGSTHDDNGDIVFAIPKERFQGHLQLKTIARDNESTEVIYITLD
ncbi:hypothetical protein Q5W88_21600 [Shouchella clausii]|uniref:hypothetical protein n=1 Tax=Shouchella clausii TaxID=79880 RepID=UPI0026F4415E|nr:hypothetical protein [Shouchella clausii]MDO7285902.1 hypothetical protein [Shouchella clausii]MDO7305805.1 hypothetical protein [Shouchella clausii]